MFDSLAEYPHWFVVACSVVAAAVVLWLLVKLIKAAMWILLFGILVIGALAVASFFLR